MSNHRYHKVLSFCMVMRLLDDTRRVMPSFLEVPSSIRDLVKSGSLLDNTMHNNSVQHHLMTLTSSIYGTKQFHPFKWYGIDEPNAPRVPKEVLMANSIGEIAKDSVLDVSRALEARLATSLHHHWNNSIPVVPPLYFPAIAFAAFLEPFIKTCYPS